jgi:hypothetical protein
MRYVVACRPLPLFQHSLDITGTRMSRVLPVEKLSLDFEWNEWSGKTLACIRSWQRPVWWPRGERVVSCELRKKTKASPLQCADMLPCETYLEWSRHPKEHAVTRRMTPRNTQRSTHGAPKTSAARSSTYDACAPNRRTDCSPVIERNALRAPPSVDRDYAT